jgi:uncharacterized protein YjbJ (UPF0337 family)
VGCAVPSGAIVKVTDNAVNDARRAVMGKDERLGNKADQAAGKVKETVGDATDNERLEAEGRKDQSKAKLKDAKEDVKEAFEK